MSIYFAYGSNMDPQHMSKRVPGARVYEVWRRDPERVDGSRGPLVLSFSRPHSHSQPGVGECSAHPAGGAGTILGSLADEHEPARLLHQLCERGREVELRKSRHIRGQCPKRCRECAPLAMDVDAKARRRRGEADGEVGGALRVHPLANSRGHEHRQ